MSAVRVEEGLLERRAQADGQFWYGGIDPDLEREKVEPSWYGGIDPEEERVMREFEERGGEGPVDPALWTAVEVDVEMHDLARGSFMP